MSSTADSETLGSQDTSRLSEEENGWEDFDYDDDDDDDEASGVGSVGARMGSMHIASETGSAGASGTPGTPGTTPPPKKSGTNCVQLNMERSDLESFFHAMNPRAETFGHDLHAWISLKIQPALVANGMTVDIAENGRSAKAKLDVPESLREPANLLGSQLDEDHILHQTFKAEIDSRREREDLKDSAQIGIKIPFRAETSTSDVLFGPDSGQSIGFCSVLENKKNQKPHPADVTCNTCFVFKQEGDAFRVKTSVSTRIFTSPNGGGGTPAAANGQGTQGNGQTTQGNGQGTQGNGQGNLNGAQSSAVSVSRSRSGARSVARSLLQASTHPDGVPMNIDAGESAVSSNTRRSKRKIGDGEAKSSEI